MAKNTFSAQVSEFVKKAEGGLDAVFKQSVADVINEAQLQGPSVARGGGKGGRMPVDTGFLRASGQLSLDGLPYGESQPVSGKTYQEPPPFTLEIAKAEPGDTIYFGWTANYARIMEARYAFLEGAVQNWRKYVDKNAREYKRRRN